MNKILKYIIPLLIVGFSFGDYYKSEIFHAILSGDYNETLLLIDKDFDINKRDKNGHTYLFGVLTLCAEASQLLGYPMGKDLINDKIIDCQQAVKVSCKLGADVNISIFNKDTKVSISPLGVAIGAGDIEIIKTLLFYKANPDIGMSGTSITTTPLMSVMMIDNNKMVVYNKRVAKYLIENGADVNKVNYIESKPYYPIAAAVTNDWIELTALLINHGAELNSLNALGRTALMAAAELGNIKMVRLLLNNGANINIKDKFGTSALGFANANNHNDILLLLKSHLRKNKLNFRLKY